MPYNGSGTFSVVNTFIPNTTISSSAMNANFTDIATNGLTNVLTRDGQSIMTGQIKAANGTVALPSYAWGTDLDTGRYRKAANVFADVCGGAEVVEYSSTGIGVTGNIAATGRVTENGGAVLPAGSILPYAGSAAPTGFLLCYGQAISRTTYATLFTAIGTAYGTGDGSTTFNLPDLRGRLPAGKDDMGGVAASRLTATTITPNGTTLGAAGGTQTHTLTAGESAVLTYTSAVTDPGHLHNVLTRGDFDTGGPGAETAMNGSTGTPLRNTNSATTGVTVATTANAGGGAHNNVQPTIILSYIIKH